MSTEWYDSHTMVSIIDIPEFAELVGRYGTKWENKPTYVLYGCVNVSIGKRVGMFAFVNNEFHASLMAKKFSEYGLVNKEITIYHNDSGNGFFDVEEYSKKLNSGIENETNTNTKFTK